MAKKRKLNSKNPKYMATDKTEKKIKKKVLMCITPVGAKVYGVWYED